MFLIQASLKTRTRANISTPKSNKTGEDISAVLIVLSCNMGRQAATRTMTTTTVRNEKSTNLVEQVVPEELEDVPLARLRPIPRPSTAAAALLGPLIQGAELEEQPQDPPVIVLAFVVSDVVVRVAYQMLFQEHAGTSTPCPTTRTRKEDDKIR